MTTNLLDSCKGLLTPELLGAAASRLGESEGAVSKALGAACPLILSGLAQKSNDPGTMGQIINLLTNRANDPGVLSNPKSVLSSDPSTSPLTELGSNLLSLLFGKDVGSITAWLSEYAGLKRTSASSLLSFVTPLIMALLGDRVHREGLGASGLTSLLATQRDGIRNAVPAGLANIVGLAGPRAYPAPNVVRTVETAGASRWIWPVAALVLLAVAGLWALTRGTRMPEIASPVANAPQVAKDAAKGVSDAAKRAAAVAGDAPRAAADAIANLGAFSPRRLPSNVELNVPERGVEVQMITFLGDSSKPLDPNLWFNFDRLLFETGSATLKPESREQLKNVAEILKAYPTVQMKIGGYTDNTGDPAANLQLSKARAISVVNELVVLGVSPDRLSAEGYGQEFPVADNSTDAGRAQNRRIAMHVTQR